MIERIVFGSVAVGLIGILISITYETRSKLFGVILIAVMCALLAFYLFQFGSLGEFSMKALSAEARFIREKRQEAQASVEEIKQLQAQIKDHTNTIAGIVTRLKTTEQQVDDSRNRILDMENQVRHALELAQPLQLAFAQIKTERIDKGLKSLIFFRASKNEALGRLTFAVALPDGSSAKLIELSPSLAGGPFSCDLKKKNVREDGILGQVSYIPMGAEIAVIEVVTSGPTSIQIQSNKLPAPVIVEVK